MNRVGLELVDEYGVLMKRAIDNSFLDLRKDLKENIAEFKKRTYSNYLNDRIVAHLKSEVSGNPDFSIVEKSGSTFFIYKSTFIIRVKKLSKKDFKASYHHTRSSIAFEQQNNFAGIVYDQTNVYLGYIEDKIGTGTDYSGVYLTCPGGEMGAPLWKIDILEFLSSKLDLFTVDSTPAHEERVGSIKRVRAKKKQIREDEHKTG